MEDGGEVDGDADAAADALDADAPADGGVDVDAARAILMTTESGMKVSFSRVTTSTPRRQDQECY